jgi:hypothetical protein
MRLFIARLSAALVCLALVVPFTQAGTIRDDRNPDLYLQLGATTQYASVGQLRINTLDGTYLGSGTLIANNWILTAAHCVDQATSLTFSINGSQYSAARWIANPQWNGDPLRGYDLGLVQLTSPISNVAPAQRYTGLSETGKVGTTVGYGMTGTGLTGATTYDGKKRAGQNSIDLLTAGLGKNAKILLTDFDNPRNRADSLLGSWKPLNLEYLAAPGDSGGGLFLDSAKGPLLAGIVSFGLAYDGKVDSDYGDLAGYTRISVFNSWIDKIIQTYASTTSGRALAAGPSLVRSFDTMTTPEPATLVLLVAGLGGMVFVRRRRRA